MTGKRVRCTYCGMNPSCITVDGTDYCSWDCMSDDYEQQQRALRLQAQKEREEQ